MWYRSGIIPHLIESMEENTMKKLGAALAAVLLVCLCAACGANTAGSTSGNTSGSASAEKSAARQAEEKFETLLKTPGNEKAALALLTENAGTWKAEKTSALLLKLEDYQLARVNAGDLIDAKLDALLQNSGGEMIQESALAAPEKIENAQVRQAVTALGERGYKIIAPEGMYQAIVDYSVYEKLADSLTPDIRAYAACMAAESDARSVEDAGLLISPAEVYARAKNCETFLKNWPDSRRATQVKTLYDGYVDDWFYGQNNTPAFGYDAGRLNDDFLESYRAAAKEKTALSDAAGKYLAVLEQNGWRLTDAVKTSRDTLTAQLKAAK
jgi:hypothetical protein